MPRHRLAVLALASVVLAPAAVRAGPAPGAVSIMVGADKLTALHDVQASRPNDGSIYGIDAGPAAVARTLSAAGAPTDAIPASISALLVDMGARKVLIDTGIGGALQESLSGAGVKPADITDILITHSHHDHIGGLVKDGRLVFANATIRLSAAEWEWLRAQAQSADIVRVIAPQVQPFAPGATPVPGITAVALPGHTPGHTGYRIMSQGRSLLDIGDAAHSSIISLAQPQWLISYDTDKNQGRATRLAVLGQVARTQELIFAPHFPFPGFGHVRQTTGAHYAWVPVTP